MYPDDLLQTLPRVLEGLHGEPGVGVDADVKAHDLLVQLSQLVKVHLCGTEGRLELVMGLTQRLQQPTPNINILYTHFSYSHPHSNQHLSSSCH